MTVELLSDLLEHELGNAFEVKNEGSLRRCVGILAERFAGTERNEREHADFRAAITKIDTRIEEGFRRMDQRFEAVDKRFEGMQHGMDRRFESMDMRFDEMSRRFDMMFRFVSLGFLILATLMSIYQFLA